MRTRTTRNNERAATVRNTFSTLIQKYNLIMDLENLDPFELIEKAHKLLDKKNEEKDTESYWEAAYNFSLASSVLASKAQIDENASLKEQKIAALYQDKSHEYLQEARKVLLQAIEQELNRDQLLLDEIPSRLDSVKLLAGESDDLNLDTNQEFMPFMRGISEEEITIRRELFQTLFIGTDASLEHEQVKQQSHEEKELSLQERLAMLDASIPRPKTDQDRINDLTSSLNKLGVYVPDHSNENSMDDYADVSEEDQLKQIMNMARDEANLDIAQGNDEGGIRDVEQILKQSSIRIDLDPSPPDYDDLIHGNLNDDNDDDSETREKTATDAEYEFWNNLEIEEEETREMTEIELMKRELANAQSLLLQASLYLEELEEKGIVFESSAGTDEEEKDDENEKKVDADTADASEESVDKQNIDDKDIVADENSDETEQDECGEKEEQKQNEVEFEKGEEERTEKLDQSNCEPIVDVHDDTIAKDVDNHNSPEIEERALHNEGFKKLQEANELVNQIMKRWPSKSTQV
ncbi:predicted protein [Chaetoceros tenuissimus]|uniref:Uncharacterized protein n=1 Tax=Chaetoceros tenuissimus TaxID=426638 RepID=A0AAD3GZ99_9STRA|nr:predicted protein [Chaetoceros tenuissimus]